MEYTNEDLQKIFEEYDKRFKEGDTRMKDLETSLGINNKTTEENNELLKSVHDKLFVGNGDKKSFVTTVEVLSVQQTWLWAAFVFIVVSIGGLYIQKLPPDTEDRKAYPKGSFIIVPPGQDTRREKHGERK